VSRKIPIPVIAVASDVLATRYTHDRIDYFMEAAGIQASRPGGNKVDKTRAWLRAANELTPEPLATFGKVITELMEVNSSGYAIQRNLIFRDRLRRNSQDRKRYEQVKRQLATQDWPDMNAYAKAKTQVIEDIIAAS